MQAEFEANGITARINITASGLSLTVFQGDEHDFLHGVHKKQNAQPDFNSTTDEASSDTYCRAEVHLMESGQDYDIMNWSEKTLLNDIVDQYQQHLLFYMY